MECDAFAILYGLGGLCVGLVFFFLWAINHKPEPEEPEEPQPSPKEFQPSLGAQRREFDEFGQRRDLGLSCGHQTGGRDCESVSLWRGYL